MAEIIIMPKLGFDMDEGQLVKWHKLPGDAIKAGDLFFEINTDKTTMPVEASFDGTVLKILLEEGEIAAVFTPIAVVGEAGEDADAAVAAYGNNAEGRMRNAESGDGAGQGSGARVQGPEYGDGDQGTEGREQLHTPDAALHTRDEAKLTPRAKRFIADNDIDPGAVAQIKGTGFDGGVTEADVKAAISGGAIKATPLAVKVAERDQVDLAGVVGTGPKGKILKADVISQGSEVRSQGPGVGDGEKQVLSVTPYKGVRKIIGDKLSASSVQSPHIYFTDEVDTGPMTRFRAEVGEAIGGKISVTDILVMAASRALAKYPGVNSSLAGDSIVTYRSTNIGVAVAGDKGLIVPVIRDVQDKSITEVAKISRGLIERARTGALSPDEYSGGTFTISNLGMFGIDNFTAIINPPEAAILAISAVKKKPVVVTVGDADQIVVRSMMNIQLSADHRLIDGLLAAQFVAYYKELIENPIRILL